jgi:hypothetical protein
LLNVVYKVQSPDASKNLGLVDMNMYRVSCAEPDRSVILVEFSLPSRWVDPRNAQLILPTFTGVTGMHPVLFELEAEPNSWATGTGQQWLTKQSIGDYTGGWWDASQFTWIYVLGGDHLAEYYNGSFALEVFTDPGWADLVIDVPATRDLLQPNPDLPLNGRLSGTWIEEDAVDQGILLSFGNPVPPAGTQAAEPENSKMNVFLSWFTFDARGEMLWLAGDAKFPQGASEVVVPLVQMTRGQFLGSQAAERTVAGSIRLKARQCDKLEADYDLAALGLGGGEMLLQRVFALEIAGYPCRDYGARLSSLSLQPAD